jgi:hypothetical protein
MDIASTPYRQPAEGRPADDEEIARRELAPDLAPGESVVWAGRPRRGIRFRLGDVVLVPFSLLWGGFSMFWEGGVVYAFVTELRRGNSVAAFVLPLFLVIGAVFVAMGQYIIWGRFVFDARRRARTFYGLTDSRALVLVRGKTRKLTAIPLLSHAWVELASEGRGRGTIHFAKQRGWDPWQLPWTVAKQGPSFEQVEHPRAVYDRIGDIQRRLAQPA